MTFVGVVAPFMLLLHILNCSMLTPFFNGYTELCLCEAEQEYCTIYMYSILYSYALLHLRCTLHSLIWFDSMTCFFFVLFDSFRCFFCRPGAFVYFFLFFFYSNTLWVNCFRSAWNSFFSHSLHCIHAYMQIFVHVQESSCICIINDERNEIKPESLSNVHGAYTIQQLNWRRRKTKPSLKINSQKHLLEQCNSIFDCCKLLFCLLFPFCSLEAAIYLLLL